VFSCRNSNPQKETEAYQIRIVLEKQNKELAEQYIGALNIGDFDKVGELLSSDYAIYSPSGYPEPSSREKLIENYTGARNAFSEFNWRIEDIIAAKDKVICRISISGTVKGTIPDLPVNEKEFKFSLITIMRMEEGKIVEEWQEDDQLGFARQMGMELKPKAEGT